MSLPEQQLTALRDRWWRLIEAILSELTCLDSYSKTQISSTFWTAMLGAKLQETFEELLEGYQIFIEDNWDVSLPAYLMEQHECVGDIVIDLAGNRTPVRLSDFVLVAKIAAIFYAEHLNPEFEPWAYFERLDQMVEKYSNP